MVEAISWGAVGLILLALVPGVLSPGPSFVMVARTAVARSRSDGLAVALGLGVGAAVIAALCLGGLHALLKAVPWLYLALKLVGGGYLVWLAWQIWRGAARPLALDAAGDAQAQRSRLWASLRLGLWTQLSNPKAAVVYGSVFAAFLPAQFSFASSGAVVAGVLTMETAWYLAVAYGLSAGAARAVYLRAKTAIDRLAALVMGALGLKLVAGAADV